MFLWMLVHLIFRTQSNLLVKHGQEFTLEYKSLYFIFELKAEKILNIPNQSPECLHEIYHKQGMPQWKCQVVVIGQRMRSNIYFKHASNISALFGWLTFVITWNETMKMKSIQWNVFTICQTIILETLR